MDTFRSNLVQIIHTKRFRVENTGTAPLEISTVSIAGTDDTQFTKQDDTCDGATLASGESCEVDVLFAPDSTGTKSAELQVESNATSSPDEAQLSGTGTAPAVSITPSSNDYGNQQVGTRSDPQTFTVENSGTSPLNISNVSLAGTNTSQFTLDNDNCSGATLPAGGSCSVDVLFAPSAAGDKSALLRIQSDSPTSPDDAQLSGKATPVPPPPQKKANLSLTKKASNNKPSVGKKLTYILKVTNKGPDRAPGVKIVDTLPKGVKLISSSKGCVKVSSRKVRCSIASLRKGQSATKKLAVKVQRSGKLVNRARASSKVKDPNPRNNRAKAVVVARVKKGSKAKGVAKSKQVSCQVKNATIRLRAGKEVVVTDTRAGKGVRCVIGGNQQVLARALKNRSVAEVRVGGKAVRAAKGKVVKTGGGKVVVRVPRGF
ncbi:MAG: choice-of-anchor D domain-containing protein [Rubrobacteraceae bacterium]